MQTDVAEQETGAGFVERELAGAGRIPPAGGRSDHEVRELPPGRGRVGVSFCGE